MNLQDDFENLTLFITGPTFISDRVKEAGSLPEFGHRDSENARRFDLIFHYLREIADVGEGYQIALIPGSGSSAMETSIRSLVADDETVLNVSVGAFGDLYHKMAVANGKKAEQLKFPAGNAINLETLEMKLKELQPSVVTFTHNETSTGVTNDIITIGQLVRKYGALPLVDGVSIFGGAPVNMQEADLAAYSTATQKSLALHAGFGMIILSDEAMAKAETVANRGYQTDVLAHMASAGKSQTLSTPNCALVNQLYVQLNHIVNTEGIYKRFERHETMKNLTHDWVDSELPEGFTLFAEEGFRSPTLTAVQVPSLYTLADLKSVKEGMRRQGYLMDPGYGKLNKSLEAEGKPLVLRGGQMGDITPEMLVPYLDTLKTELVKVRD